MLRLTCQVLAKKQVTPVFDRAGSNCAGALWVSNSDCTGFAVVEIGCFWPTRKSFIASAKSDLLISYLPDIVVL